MRELVEILGIPFLLVVFAATYPSAGFVRKSVGVLALIYEIVLLVRYVPLLASGAFLHTLAPGFALDNLSLAFILLTGFAFAFTLLHCRSYFLQEEKLRSIKEPRAREFFVISCALLIPMMLVYLCDNLAYLWMSVETTTLISAGLVYFDRTKRSLEATWKYFIICSVGIAMALMGTILIFAASQYAVSGGSLSFTELIKVAPKANGALLSLGFIMCFLGYATKSGAFPLHGWLPDAYSEAPAPASALLSGAFTNCALYSIFRILSVVDAGGEHFVFNKVVIWAGVITVVTASVFLVKQYGLKRLWAYSSIENAGLILVAIGLKSTPLFFLQCLNHSVVKVALFLVAGNLIQLVGSKRIHDIRGVLKASPITGILILFGGLAVTGAPPFGAFISEWSILAKACDSHEYAAVVFLLIGLVVSFIAVVGHVCRMLLGQPKGGLLEPHFDFGNDAHGVEAKVAVLAPVSASVVGVGVGAGSEKPDTKVGVDVAHSGEHGAVGQPLEGSPRQVNNLVPALLLIFSLAFGFLVSPLSLRFLP